MRDAFMGLEAVLSQLISYISPDSSQMVQNLFQTDGGLGKPFIWRPQSSLSHLIPEKQQANLIYLNAFLRNETKPFAWPDSLYVLSQSFSSFHAALGSVSGCLLNPAGAGMEA